MWSSLIGGFFFKARAQREAIRSRRVVGGDGFGFWDGNAGPTGWSFLISISVGEGW